MVPVLSRKNIPLTPCSEKRSRKLIERGEAKAMWKNQIFCIQLLKDPSRSYYPDVTIGIDPGSKKEGMKEKTPNSMLALRVGFFAASVLSFWAGCPDLGFWLLIFHLSAMEYEFKFPFVLIR